LRVAEPHLIALAARPNNCVHLPGRQQRGSLSKNVIPARSSATRGSLRLLAWEFFDVTRLGNWFDFQTDAANYDKVTMKVSCFKADRSFHNAGQWNHSAEFCASRNVTVVESAW
jgi:hypothetical protein